VSLRPLLLGHRGVRARGLRRLAASLPQENSLAAFEYALAHGCDGFEFDVRHTRDGRNVLWHDPECCGKEIATTDYSDLADQAGNQLACLEDVLAEFGHRAYLDIELKVSGGEESIVAALRVRRPQRAFIVSSFLPEVLLCLRLLDANLPLGILCDRGESMAAWRALPIGVLLPQEGLVTQSLVAEAHGRSLQIMTWTVNDSRRILELAGWGIDGLISDSPQLLYQTFHSD